jgi:IS1 family transposase
MQAQMQAFAADAYAKYQLLETQLDAQAARANAKSDRPPKPEFFSGEDKERLRVLDWTRAVTQYFRAVGTAEDKRVMYAACLLRGPALRWFHDIPNEHLPVTWEDFTQRLIAYFIPAGTEVTARSQLVRLYQRTSVAEYTDRFRAIAANVPTMTDAEKRNTYTTGLKSEVRKQVAFANPSTFEETVAIASRIDDILFQEGRRDVRRLLPRADGASTSAAAANGPAPMDLSVIRRNPAPNTDGPRLSDRERERLRSIDACFRCRQPGHMSSQCPLRAQGNGQRRQ